MDKSIEERIVSSALEFRCQDDLIAIRRFIDEQLEELNQSRFTDYLRLRKLRCSACDFCITSDGELRILVGIPEEYDSYVSLWMAIIDRLEKKFPVLRDNLYFSVRETPLRDVE